MIITTIITKKVLGTATAVAVISLVSCHVLQSRRGKGDVYKAGEKKQGEK